MLGRGSISIMGGKLLRHRNLKLKRVKQLPNGDLGDYLDGRIRVKISHPKQEIAFMMHEFTHALFEFYEDYLREKTSILNNLEVEETIARQMEETIEGLIEIYEK